MEKDFHGLPVLCTADLSNNIISHIAISLVMNTRCSTHGVPSKLKIYLQGMTTFTSLIQKSLSAHKYFFFFILENPVLCDDNLPELVAAMEMQQARLLGIAHCIVPQQIVDSSVIMEPPMILQRMMKPQAIAVAPNLLQPLQPPPSIVQIIVPASMAAQQMQSPTNNNATAPVEPSNETIDVAAENNEEPVAEGVVAEVLIEATSSTTAAAPVEDVVDQEQEQDHQESSNESEQNETHVVPEDEEPVIVHETGKENDDEVEEEEKQQQVESDDTAEERSRATATITTTTTTTTTPPPDVIGNIIHEVYSPIPEVLSPIGAQALSAAEAPPESSLLLDAPEDTEP